MKPSADEVYAVNATVKALDKLDTVYLQHPALKVACRAARASFARGLAEAQASSAAPKAEGKEKSP